MRTFLLVVHIAAAAAWFGHKLMTPHDIRGSLSDHGQASAMIERVGAAAPLGIASALITVASGVGLLVLNSWTATALLGVGIMAALGAIAVGASSARRAWRSLVGAVGKDDLALAAAFGRRFSRAMALENLLWLAALAAMVAG
jgi:hypothetical protein